MKKLELEITKCQECPYLKEGIYKGLGDEVYSCTQVSETSVSSSFTRSRRVADKHDLYDTPIPDWCPLPDAKTSV